MAHNSTAASTTLAWLADLSDRELIEATVRTVRDEQRTTAELIALLAELDVRKLYLSEGYASLFTYCTRQLHLSEPAAYRRITIARASRRFPLLRTRLADGDVTLSTVTLLAPHLTDENHEPLLDAVRYASKRDVERLIASLYAPPDIPPLVRRLPTVTAARATAAPAAHERARTTGADERADVLADTTRSSPHAQAASSAAIATPLRAPAAPARRHAAAPLGVNRYLLRVTIDEATHAKLARARDLLRHTIPNGDLAAIVDRALTSLVNQLERRRIGRAARPSTARAAATRSHGRHIPAGVRRVVWARDQGRCAFIGAHGRCHETGFLEYHHVVPFAAGGLTDAANLELRCRAHNAYEASRYFRAEDGGTSRNAS